MSISHRQAHCNENPVYVFPEKKLGGLIPGFHIRVSVSDLYISMLGLPILLQENMWTDPGNILYKSLKDHMNVGLRPRNSFIGKY